MRFKRKIGFTVAFIFLIVAYHNCARLNFSKQEEPSLPISIQKISNIEVLENSTVTRILPTAANLVKVKVSVPDDPSILCREKSGLKQGATLGPTCQPGEDVKAVNSSYFGSCSELQLCGVNASTVEEESLGTQKVYTFTYRGLPWGCQSVISVVDLAQNEEVNLEEPKASSIELAKVHNEIYLFNCPTQSCNLTFQVDGVSLPSLMGSDCKCNLSAKDIPGLEWLASGKYKDLSTGALLTLHQEPNISGSIATCNLVCDNSELTLSRTPDKKYFCSKCKVPAQIKGQNSLTPTLVYDFIRDDTQKMCYYSLSGWKTKSTENMQPPASSQAVFFNSKSKTESPAGSLIPNCSYFQETYMSGVYGCTGQYEVTKYYSAGSSSSKNELGTVNAMYYWCKSYAVQTGSSQCASSGGSAGSGSGSGGGYQ